MLSKQIKASALAWLPTVFCAVLSLISLASLLAMSALGPAQAGSWAIVFLCFLPMCFLFVGSGLWQMQRELGELRAQVAELRERQAA